MYENVTIVINKLLSNFLKSIYSLIMGSTGPNELIYTHILLKMRILCLPNIAIYINIFF